MMYKPHISDKMVTIVGGLFLFSIVLSGWFPRSCPLLRQAIAPCTAPAPIYKTDKQKELDRIPHQTVTTTNLTFTTASQDYRKETIVNFQYKTTQSFEVAYLQIKYADGYHDLALITHPILTDLKWPVIDAGDFQLYQEDGEYQSMDSFFATLPPATQFAADRVVAKERNLAPGSYTPLENLGSIGAMKYILTSYPKQQVDGTWYKFSKEVNIQDAVVSERNELEWMIERSKTSDGISFHIGTVHVDYRKIKP